MAALPPRVTLSPLPALLVYEHCPFCIRARYVLGLKNVKYNLVWLMNDDVDTPTDLIGKKMVPIFQPDGPAGKSIAESLDICKLIDSDPRYGEPGLLREESGRTDIQSILDDIGLPFRRLYFARTPLMPLPEFAFEDGRKAFVKNHPLSDPESYDENLRRSPEYIDYIKPRLEELANMIYSKEYCTEGGLSYDDVKLFPMLTLMTSFKGLLLPEKIKEYVAFQSEKTEAPTFEKYAV